jgi:hypothetical protein
VSFLECRSSHILDEEACLQNQESLLKTKRSKTKQSLQKEARLIQYQYPLVLEVGTSLKGPKKTETLLTLFPEERQWICCQGTNLFPTLSLSKDLKGNLGLVVFTVIRREACSWVISSLSLFTYSIVFNHIQCSII